MAGRLFHRGSGRPGEFSYLAEEVVEGLLKVSPPGDRKIHTADELRAALGESARRPSAITLWIVEEMETHVR